MRLPIDATLWVDNSRKSQVLPGYFRWPGRERSAALSRACVKAVSAEGRREGRQAAHVKDCSNVMMQISKAPMHSQMSLPAQDWRSF